MSPGIDLLHIVGEVPEGRWAIFSLPHGDGSEMISVVIPHTLWALTSRQHPFLSDLGLMEQMGRQALQHRIAEGRLAQPVMVGAEDVGLALPVEPKWFAGLSVCGTCSNSVPPGEVLEGIANALPPDSRGEVEILVLCPRCQVQTPHRLTPYGIPQG